MQTATKDPARVDIFATRVQQNVNHAKPTAAKPVSVLRVRSTTAVKDADQVLLTVCALN